MPFSISILPFVLFLRCFFLKAFVSLYVLSPTSIALLLNEGNKIQTARLQKSFSSTSSFSWGHILLPESVRIRELRLCFGLRIFLGDH